jgi:hypothetical protein
VAGGLTSVGDHACKRGQPLDELFDDGDKKKLQLPLRQDGLS